jgi:hypothetical protein
MEVRVQLVHADGQVRVVHVSAYSGEQLLGSALGEATDAEAAEDRALERLLTRLAAGPARGAGLGPAFAANPVEAPAASAAAAAPLATLTPRSGALTAMEPRDKQREKTAQPPLPAVPTPSKAEIHSPPAPATFATAMESSSPHQQPEEAAKAPAELPAPHPVEAPEVGAAPPPEPAAEPPADPEDWSSELLHLDRELQRLQWGRAEEEVYLQRAFGHPSRNRLTSYADLLAYLRAVEALNVPADPAVAAVPMRRQDLLSQCDALLRQLGWPRERARQFLESQLQVSSRQQLSDQDLLQFNLLLEGELLAAGE